MWVLPQFFQAAVALLIERAVGYPQGLHKLIGHPVEWLGALVAFLDRTLNRPASGRNAGRARGVLALVIVLIAAALPALVLSFLFHTSRLGWLLDPLLATTLIAQSSLRQHVAAVRDGLRNSLHLGRAAVAMIVGRDPHGLDESGVARAALESLAENTADGVVAPVLWYALLGLPGIALYKAINTADSMIGHKSERYLHFGWAAARLDDLVNLPASRLTGLLFALVSRGRFKTVLAVMRRDAGKHQSPNAGWPESAMAAALGLRFGGPRSYHGEPVDLPWMGDGRETLTRDDITAGLDLYGRALTLLALLAIACGLAT